MGWYGPVNCGCCGECVCPECGLTDWKSGVVDPETGLNTLAKCRLYWSCCDCEGCEVTLEGETYDYGVVAPAGNIAANDGETYTLISTGPDCETQTITFTMDNDCPCATGCMTGQVEGAKTSATLTVSNYASGSQVTNPSGFYRLDSADLSGLNHTKTVDVLSFRYLNDDDETCAFDYIDPFADYFVAQVTVYSYLYTFDPGSGGVLLGTSYVVWDVYGTITTATDPVVGTTSIGAVYRLKWVKSSQSIYNHPTLGNVVPPGGTTTPMSTNHTYTPDGTLALDLTFSPPSTGGGTRGHFYWCDEKMSIGRIDGGGGLGQTVSAPWTPSGWFGLFQWESLA